ncbi:hypothetical protein EDB89DRAFT_2154697 [Lactarius sanguifluus]|nr:hypothetical protein EDB89DRAFT_2154697 [Lactarius sanguifluus]
MASQRLTTTDHDTRIPAKRMAREPTTDDDDDDVARRRELRLIVALLTRHATRLAHDQVSPRRADTPDKHDRRETTTRQHATRQRQDTTRTDNRDYQRSTAQSTTRPANAGQNRYAALDAEATCDDVHVTRTDDTWTIVTRKRKRTQGKNTMPTPSRPDPPMSNPQSQPSAAKVEAHAGTTARGDARQVEAHAEVPARGDAHVEVEAHAGITARGDAYAEVEAHAEVPACGDAHPFPISSPDHGVTPLAECLDAQSDVLGVAHIRSPRMAEMLRRIREVTSTTVGTSQTEEG